MTVRFLSKFDRLENNIIELWTAIQNQIMIKKFTFLLQKYRSNQLTVEMDLMRKEIIGIVCILNQFPKTEGRNIRTIPYNIQ